MIERVLGRFDEVVFTQYGDNPRAVPAEELEAIARELCGRPSPVYADAAAAADAVRRLAAADDLICVTGSLFIAAQMRRLWKDEG
jgi:dihydrofolate synthase/folylpolyglutamate synthase